MPNGFDRELLLLLAFSLGVAVGVSVIIYLLLSSF
jgi:hypothetical protein